MLVILETCTWSLSRAIEIMDGGHYILSQEDADESWLRVWDVVYCGQVFCHEG